MRGMEIGMESMVSPKEVLASGMTNAMKGRKMTKGPGSRNKSLPIEKWSKGGVGEVLMKDDLPYERMLVCVWIMLGSLCRADDDNAKCSGPRHGYADDVMNAGGGGTMLWLMQVAEKWGRKRAPKKTKMSLSIVNPARRSNKLYVPVELEYGQNSPSWSSRYGLEVGSAALDEVRKDLSPILTDIPGNLGGGVDFDGHHLRGTSALNDDDESANTAVLTAPLLAALNVSNDKGVANVCSRNNVCGRDGESRVTE